jgi:hypothetical protein
MDVLSMKGYAGPCFRVEGLHISGPTPEPPGIPRRKTSEALTELYRHRGDSAATFVVRAQMKGTKGDSRGEEQGRLVRK